MSLVGEVSRLRKSSVQSLVNKRLKEFSSCKNWFSELCFCILTANSKASTAIAIQNEVETKGFLTLTQKQLTKIIRNNKHRFHNNKSKYIVEARKHKNIKTTIKKFDSKLDARNWIAENVKGLGYKEASHFLRNVGYCYVAILDRHVLNLMSEHGLVEMPKTLTKKKYLEIEKKFLMVADILNMKPAELDLYMWYMKTGKVLK